MRLAALASVCFLSVWLASPAGAGSITDQFHLTITIQAGCELSGPSDLNFGTHTHTHTFIDTAITASTSFTIRCSSGTTGTIALNGGSGGSQSISPRTMENATNSVDYNVYTAAPKPGRTLCRICPRESRGKEGDRTARSA